MGIIITCWLCRYKDYHSNLRLSYHLNAHTIKGLCIYNFYILQISWYWTLSKQTNMLHQTLYGFLANEFCVSQYIKRVWRTIQIMAEKYIMSINSVMWRCKSLLHCSYFKRHNTKLKVWNFMLNLWKEVIWYLHKEKSIFTILSQHVNKTRYLSRWTIYASASSLEKL